MRLVPLTLLLALIVAVMLSQDHHGHAMPALQASDPSCAVVPMGALPGQPAPVWCYDPMETGPTTHTSGANSWEDGFDHHLSLSDLGAGYRTFAVGSLGRVRHWRHQEHWMVDVEGNDADGPPPWDLGAVMMRPDRAFRAVDGVLTIEAEVAAGVAANDTGAPGANDCVVVVGYM